MHPTKPILTKRQVFLRNWGDIFQELYPVYGDSIDRIQLFKRQLFNQEHALFCLFVR